MIMILIMMAQNDLGDVHPNLNGWVSNTFKFIQFPWSSSTSWCPKIPIASKGPICKQAEPPLASNRFLGCWWGPGACRVSDSSPDTPKILTKMGNWSGDLKMLHSGLMIQVASSMCLRMFAWLDRHSFH
jgi:hypothetical protein